MAYKITRSNIDMGELVQTHIARAGEVDTQSIDMSQADVMRMLHGGEELPADTGAPVESPDEQPEQKFWEGEEYETGPGTKQPDGYPEQLHQPEIPMGAEWLDLTDGTGVLQGRMTTLTNERLWQIKLIVAENIIEDIEGEKDNLINSIMQQVPESMLHQSEDVPEVPEGGSGAAGTTAHDMEAEGPLLTGRTEDAAGS